MLLEVDRITAGYGHAPIIEDISLGVETGEIVCIIGPNGAGKSTVLRTIAGQLTPSAGRVRYAGEDITRLAIAERGRRGLMFIPQGMNIFPNLTVRENLEIAGLLISGKQAKAAGHSAKPWTTIRSSAAKKISTPATFQAANASFWP